MNETKLKDLVADWRKVAKKCAAEADKTEDKALSQMLEARGEAFEEAAAELLSVITTTEGAK